MIEFNPKKRDMRDVKFLFPAMEPKGAARKSHFAAGGKERFKWTQAVSDNMMMYFSEGEDLKDWYTNTYPELEKIFSVNGVPDHNKVALMIDLLAATSPRYTIKMNVERALFLMEAIENGWIATVKINFEAHMGNVCRAILGLPLSGPKVRAFQANLWGKSDAVTIDTWMMKALGMTRQAPDAAEYSELSNVVREMASRVGVTPAQFQAAVWVGIKRLTGDEADTAEPFENILGTAKAELDNQKRFNFEEMKEEFSYADENAERKAIQESEEAELPQEEVFAFNPVGSGSELTRQIKALPPKQREIVGIRLALTGDILGGMEPRIFDWLFKQTPINQLRAIYAIRKYDGDRVRQGWPLTLQDIMAGIQSEPIVQRHMPKFGIEGE